MNTYLINFAAYSFAMIGFILTIVYVYKKTTNPAAFSKNKAFLKVENVLKLSPVKTIYVIKAGEEKFLIAADASNTTMLSKLENVQKAEVSHTGLKSLRFDDLSEQSFENNKEDKNENTQIKELSSLNAFKKLSFLNFNAEAKTLQKRIRG